MAGYEEMGNDASDASDAPAKTATPRGQEHEGSSQSGQMVPWIGVESETNGLGDLGVLRATSGNATKRLKTRAITRAGKSAQAIIMKQIATEERQAEKGKMKEWKENIMQEVARELHVIREMHEEAMEAQRESFQLELERMGGKVQQLESEVKALKIPAQQLACKTPPAKAVASPRSDSQEEREREQTEQAKDQNGSQKHQQTYTHTPKSNVPNQLRQSAKPNTKSYAQIASTNAAPTTSEKAWTEVRYNNRKQKNSSLSPPKTEPEKRRVIFRRASKSPQKSEADLMLVLNETLQRLNLPAYVRFSKVGYSQSGAISGLLTEKSNAEDLLRDHATTLIRAAKSVDEGVIGVEALERWHRLKVHGMPLMRYLGEGKMELLYREIESSTGIKLKTTPRWLINEERLEERLESGNGRGSAIVITVGNEAEASKLCAKGLRFGGAPKVVEKYWEAGPSSICMTCSGIGHDRLGGCGERPIQCVICAGAHKSENHKCGVTGCTAKKGKICIHVVPKCANCGGNHQATAFRCPARQKAQAKAWKNKTKKASNREERETIVESHEDREISVKNHEDRELSIESQNDEEVTP